MPTRTLPIFLLILATAACAQDGDTAAENGAPTVDGAADGRSDGAGAQADDSGSQAEDPAGGDRGSERPATRTDTIFLEGMAEPMEFQLFRTPDGFPLHFSAYVPEDMEADVLEDDAAAVRFMAAFGGQRNPEAFLHVYVHPTGTDPQTAVGTMRSFGASRGIPVSMGIEPLPEPEATQRMPWADRGFGFRYQGDDGWIVGSMGLGSHDGRLFHVITHYPEEYGDGFGPRSAKILETWQWEDGTSLADGES